MMRTLLAAILTWALLLAPALAGEPELNAPLEAYRIRTLAGSDITPATQRGRILVVNLWATWCAPCRKEMPEIERFYRAYRAQGVDVVAVTMDERDELPAVKKFMADYSFPAALAADSDIAALGRLRHVPATFIVDRDGRLVRNGWLKPASVDFATLENTVKPLLGGARK